MPYKVCCRIRGHGEVNCQSNWPTINAFFKVIGDTAYDLTGLSPTCKVCTSVKIQSVCPRPALKPMNTFVCPTGLPPLGALIVSNGRLEPVHGRQDCNSQRVHVGIWHILRAQRGSHIPTLRPKYIPYTYMDPLGLDDAARQWAPRPLNPCLGFRNSTG